MARISRRLGRLGVDWVDAEGKRRWKTFEDQTEAQMFLARQLAEAGKPLSADAGVTVGEYAPRWLSVAAVRVRATTLVKYKRILRNQITPGLGLSAVSKVTQAQIRDWIAALMTREKKPLARNSGVQVLATLSQMFDQAVDDGLRTDNPVKGLPKKLRLTTAAVGRDIQAMTALQLGEYLQAVQKWEPEWFLPFYLLAMTGLRMGEAFGLQWEDVDEKARTIRIERQLREDGVIAEPKSAASKRTVDAPEGLLRLISAHKAQRSAVGMAAGRGGAGRWILAPWSDEPTMAEVVQERNAIRYAMRACLRKAKLPPQFTPHSFRHTFASIHLSRGESVKWVKEQLGHESIAITVDLYGRWLKTESSSAAAGLEALISGGSK